MARKSTIGENPLDAVVPAKRTAGASSGTREGREGAGDLSIARGPNREGAGRGLLDARSHNGEPHGKCARGSIGARGEEARQAGSVTRGRRSQDGKTSEGRLT
jgi:hypothetical protein